VTRGTDAAAGKRHLHGIGCAAGKHDEAMLAGGNLEEVADVTIIHAR
jgi:hypothetical protein